MKMKCKKGFTLVELCIVMALVAIVGVMMTSFIAVFQPRVAQNQARHDFLDEVALVRDEMQKWISNSDHNGVSLVVVEDDADSKIIYMGIAQTAQFVTFSKENGILTFEYTDEAHNKSLTLKTIKSITLAPYLPEPTGEVAEGEVQQNPSNYGRLLVCTLSGTDAFNKEYKQSFVFSLRSSGATFANDEAPTEP